MVCKNKIFILTAHFLPSFSFQPRNRMEEQLPSSERARQGEKQTFTKLIFTTLTIASSEPKALHYKRGCSLVALLSQMLFMEKQMIHVKIRAGVCKTIAQRKIVCYFVLFCRMNSLKRPKMKY